MEFSVESKALSDVIAKARKVAPKAIDVNFVSKSDSLYLVVSADGATARFRINNANVQDESDPVTVPIDQLSGVIKNRKVLTFKSSETGLEFTDKDRYKGKLEIPPYEPIKMSKPAEGTVIDLSDEAIAEVFSSVISTASLPGSFNNADNMLMFISLSDKGICALSYDTYYLARVQDNSVEFEPTIIVVDSATLNTATTIAGKSKYTLTITSDSLYAHNQEFFLRMPSIQSEDSEESLASINEFIETWTNTQDKTALSSDITQFTEVMDNMSTFYERGTQGTPVKFQVSKQGVTVSIDGKGGTISEKIEGQVTNPSKTPFLCEYALLSELVPKIKSPTVNMAFIEDNVMMFISDDGVRNIFLSAALVSND